MNNAVYGKFIENLKDRTMFQIRLTNENAQKIVNSPRFANFKIFNENIVGIEMRRQKTILNRPIPIGVAILDYSKYCMYNFHYNTMNPLYGNGIELLYTDTDSLIYSIETDDIYEDMLKHNELFDLSSYDNKHQISKE